MKIPKTKSQIPSSKISTLGRSGKNNRQMRPGVGGVVILIVVAIVIFIFTLVIPLALLFGLPHVGPIAKATGGGGVTAQAFATAYCPVNGGPEGGPVDHREHPIYTIQDFVSGKAPYVSVAMDSALDATYPYGTVIHIPELDKKYNNGQPIEFHLVDHGSAFEGKGLSRIDIANYGSSAKDCPAASDNWENMNVTLNINGGNQQAVGSCPSVITKLLTKSSIQTRATGTPKVIILHYTADENGIDTEYSYFNNNGKGGGGDERDVDVQYEVFHSGQVVQYEPDNMAAHGAKDYNQPTKDYGSGAISISIENQGDFESTDPAKQETAAQVTANINLVNCLMKKYNILKDNVKIKLTAPNSKEPYNVISHKEADARTNQNHRSDPGARFMNKVVSALQ